MGARGGRSTAVSPLVWRRRKRPTARRRRGGEPPAEESVEEAEAAEVEVVETAMVSSWAREIDWWGGMEE